MFWFRIFVLTIFFIELFNEIANTNRSQIANKLISFTVFRNFIKCCNYLHLPFTDRRQFDTTTNLKFHRVKTEGLW